MIKCELLIKPVNWENVKEFYNKYDSFNKNKTENISVDIEKINYVFDSEYNHTMTFAAYLKTTCDKDKELIGVCSFFEKNYEHMRIGGVGKMAVKSLYRKNEIATELLRYMKIVMEKNNIDISVLWASVLKVYEKVGYKAYYKNIRS